MDGDMGFEVFVEFELLVCRIMNPGETTKGKRHLHTTIGKNLEIVHTTDSYASARKELIERGPDHIIVQQKRTFFSYSQAASDQGKSVTTP